MTGSFVILGDGIAGSTAAETLRERDPDADITVITDEGEPLYNRILIKEFAKGKLPEAPIAIHEEQWYEDRSIDLALNTHVTRVDTGNRTVHAADGRTFGYDRLLVATGGTPAQLPAGNSDADGIHHFWTFQDARAIREHVEAADNGVVIGAGLLGIDFAAICGAQGLEGRYLMRGSRWWRDALSHDGAEIVHDELRGIGVEPVFDTSVDRFALDDDGHVVAALDDAGDRHPADWVGVAIGLNFNTEFLQGTDVDLEWGVVVDEYMRTNDPHVYAAGDITRFHDFYLEERIQNGSWGSAKEQGRVAGTNMFASLEDDLGPRGSPADGLEHFEWVPSYSITHFDLPFLSFGHPTGGDEAIERRYDDREWRRLTFKDGRLIGGVLLGDLAPQRAYKQLIRERRVVSHEPEVLLTRDFDPEALEVVATD
ncbi:MAG: NAD(P)/FAD-dependent oxidoreductase [Halobacteriales archaeon]